VLQVDRLEQPVAAEQHLGPAEEEDAARDQRQVEAVQHAFLRLGVEVHQGVAAQQEVEAARLQQIAEKVLDIVVGRRRSQVHHHRATGCDASDCRAPLP
jgi:hypothetical protein